VLKKEEMTGLRRRTAWALATWFGCGMTPLAPGTAGTLGAIPLYLLVVRGGRSLVIATAIVATLVGVWAASVVAREIGKKDPQFVVVDEVAGMLITMVPMDTLSWRGTLVGFVLFRTLDTLKPWPIRWFERLPGGWGIVLDDVAAGVVAACVIAALRVANLLP
jgi:phosphatidylglycerophosphatase A